RRGDGARARRDRRRRDARLRHRPRRGGRRHGPRARRAPARRAPARRRGRLPPRLRARAAAARRRLRGDLLRRPRPAPARPALQLVVGSEAIYCDARGRLVPARAVADPRLVEAARRALPAAPVLPIGTSARVGGSTGADVEAMEGFAVLRAAELAGVPAVEVRAISNEVEEPDRARWRLGEALAV